MSKNITRIPCFMSRIRHFGGHGVHSPFAYDLTRNALTKRRIAGSDTVVFDALSALGAGRCFAVLVQNLYTYLGYDNYMILGSDENVDNYGTTFVIALSPHIEKLLPLMAEKTGGAACVAMPRSGRLRRGIRGAVIANHRGLSIERGGAMMLFFDKGLNEQHIRL